MKESVRIALAQISCNLGAKKQNMEKMAEYVWRARDQGAELIIFPELSLTGYTLRDRVYSVAETVPGNSTKIVARLAKEAELYVIFGMPELAERTQATIYNTAVFVGPSGYIGKYRKLYLPTHSVFEEKRYFRPGYHTGVFDTELGGIGLTICYDIFFPEVTRLSRIQGAQLIVCISASPTTRRAYFETLTMARSIENAAFLAYVNLVGIEDGLQFWGGSRLVGPSGELVTVAACDKEDLAVGEANYVDIKPIETFIPTLKDLRPDLFGKLKEAAEEL